MASPEKATPANRGGDSGRQIERIGGRLDLQNNEILNPLQDFLVHIAAAFVVVLLGSAPR